MFPVIILDVEKMIAILIVEKYGIIDITILWHCFLPRCLVSRKTVTLVSGCVQTVISHKSVDQP